MFLSTFTAIEDSETGNYFSYPQTTNRLQKNVQVCLPRGFTSSGPEYQMYKDNCMDLMADQCAVEWSPLCNSYQSNLNKVEQDIFKQYVEQRSVSHPYAPNNSCIRTQSSIVPEQVEIRGINPYVDQNTGLAFPLSCPSKVNGSIQTAEFIGHQVYQHEQQRNRTSATPFSYSSNQENHQSKTTPIPFVPRPNGPSSFSQTPIPFYPDPSEEETKVEPSDRPSEVNPDNQVSMNIPVSQEMVQDHQLHQRMESQSVSVQQPDVTSPEEKNDVTPIPFLPGDHKPAFMPEQLNIQGPAKKVSFALPSSPLSMFVTDEAAINELIYGADADCEAKTACSISKIMN